MDLRIRNLEHLDARAVPLPHGTEVVTRVDRIAGERRVPQGSVGRVTKTEGDTLEECNRLVGRYALTVTAFAYRVSAPEPPDPYMVAWTALRRRRRLSTLCLLTMGFMLIVVVEASMSTHLWLIVVLPLMPILPTYFAAPFVEPFRCPRCARPFFRSLATELSGAGQCQHCYIEIGTPKSRR